MLQPHVVFETRYVKIGANYYTDLQIRMILKFYKNVSIDTLPYRRKTEDNVSFGVLQTRKHENTKES